MHISRLWLFELLQVRNLITKYKCQFKIVKIMGKFRLDFDTKPFSYIFSSNILTVLDQRCSGRYACRVKVTDFIDYRSSCTTELASYLQARYRCESGKLNKKKRF